MQIVSHPPSYGGGLPPLVLKDDFTSLERYWNMQVGSYSFSGGYLNIPATDNARIFKSVESPPQTLDFAVEAAFPSLPTGAFNQGYGTSLWLVQKDFNFDVSSIGCYCQPTKYTIRLNNTDYVTANFPATQTGPFVIRMVKSVDQSAINFFINDYQFYSLPLSALSSTSVFGYGIYSNGAASGQCDYISGYYYKNDLLYLDPAVGTNGKWVSDGPYKKYMGYTNDNYMYDGTASIYRSGGGGSDASDGNDAYFYTTPNDSLDQYGKLNLTNLTAFPSPQIALRMDSLTGNSNARALFGSVSSNAWRIFTTLPGNANTVAKTILASGTGTNPTSGTLEFYAKPDGSAILKYGGVVIGSVPAGTVTLTGMYQGFGAGAGSNRITRVELGKNGTP